MKAITKSRRRIRILSLLLILVLIPQFAAYSFAEEAQTRSSTTSPQAYFFVYNNGGSFSTTACASNAVLSNLWNMGFSAGSYLNNYATTIFSVINNKEVTVITGDGFWCETMLPGPSRTTIIHADRLYNETDGIYDIGDYDVVLSDLATNTSSNKTSNLVIVAAKFSAYQPPMTQLPSGAYYNTPSVIGAMRNKVTDCAIGWTGHAHADRPEMARWLELFFEYCYDGETIENARLGANQVLQAECSIGLYNGDEGRYIYNESASTGYKNRYIDD